MNKRISRRWEKAETPPIWPWIVILLLIGITLLLPQSGTGGMLKEIGIALVFCTAALFVIVKVLHNPENSRTIKGLVLGIGLAVSLWCVHKPVLDLLSGPVTTTLSDIQIHRRAGVNLFSRHVFLVGETPQGQRLQLEISEQDADRLAGRSSLTVTFYRRCRRLVHYELPAENQRVHLSVKF